MRDMKMEDMQLVPFKETALTECATVVETFMRLTNRCQNDVCLFTFSIDQKPGSF